jgi:protein-L-isoaspartate O-methyltransferase
VLKALPAGARFRPVRIKTALRPDYLEWFPLLGDLELVTRLAALDFSVATFQVPRNVERAAELYPDSPAIDAYLRDLSRTAGRSGWREVLKSLGFDDAVIAAFDSVDRRDFTPPRYRSLAWMNQAIWYAPGSCMSATGLVALMANAVACSSFDVVVEVGYGGGFQLAVFGSLFPGASLIGFEANEVVAVIGADALRARGLGARLVVSAVPFSVERWPRSAATLVYATCAISSERYEEWEAHLLPVQTLLAPRALSEQEYVDARKDPGFLEIYGTYDEYLKKGNYLVLSLSERSETGIVRSNLVYDIQMVPYRATAVRTPLADDEFADSWLSRSP